MRHQDCGEGELSDQDERPGVDLVNAMNELWKVYGSRCLEEGEFTVSMLAEQRGVHYDEARRVISRALAAGQVTRRTYRNGWAYRFKCP